MNPKTAEDKILKDNFIADLKMLPKNIFDICEYSFMEMLNNAIDHSEGSEFDIAIEWASDTIEIAMVDNGIGIFNKIINILNLEDIRESALHLSKGKFIIDPKNHTGEGIFFRIYRR